MRVGRGGRRVAGGVTRNAYRMHNVVYHMRQLRGLFEYALQASRTSQTYI